MRRTQVAIVGAGPAGLMLARLLDREGIDNVVVERRSPDYVLGRIRAGVLEDGTVRLLEEAGLGRRMREEGLPHTGIELSFDGDSHRIDFADLIGREVMVYGQTEVTRDLMAARADSGGLSVYEAEEVALHGLDGDAPRVTYLKEGVREEIACDFVAGCDGFRGVSRAAIPRAALTERERVYPFGWLGILVDRPPVADELIYAHHERGFALCSMRSAARSRYYVQCAVTERVEDWPDERFYGELRRRLDPEVADRLETGPSIEKSIAPLRSFVAEPLRFGRLFLAGDAAHIVPPTGAKGLNLAIADVALLAPALDALVHRDPRPAGAYERTALDRVWRTTYFSWWMTSMLHTSGDEFDAQLQLAQLRSVTSSTAASTSLAESYVGLPLP